MAMGLLVIWGGGQLARQIIQPKIVGDSIGMEPIPTLFLLYVGYKLGSVVGMIIAVPLGMLVSTMYQEGVFDTTKNSIDLDKCPGNHDSSGAKKGQKIQKGDAHRDEQRIIYPKYSQTHHQQQIHPYLYLELSLKIPAHRF